MPWYFLFFFVSGFCGILYEIVWLRLSMAQFGVTNALVSIVLSMFMAGLGIGSWGSGRLVRRYGDRAATIGLRLYAVAELLIGASALLVPLQLRWGHAFWKIPGLPPRESIPGLRNLDRAYVDSLVRLHGRDYPSGDGVDQAQLSA